MKTDTIFVQDERINNQTKIKQVTTPALQLLSRQLFNLRPNFV